MSEKINRKRLYEVDYIRIVLILLLVFYHSFAPFSGAWEPLQVSSDVVAYWWLDKLSYAFLLESFVFISGYILGFQVQNNGKDVLSLKEILSNKFKRLIIPCVFFSGCYVLLFIDTSNLSIINILYSLFAGVGHLWFLPMLFWCFIILFCIEKLSIRPYVVYMLSILFSVCHTFQLPFRLDNSLYYFLFFYLGYSIKRYNLNYSRFFTRSYIYVTLLFFCLLFIVLTLLDIYIDEYQLNSIPLLYSKAIKYITHNVSKLLYSFFGVQLLFLVSNYIVNKNIFLFETIRKASELSMGVYIIHQFILKYLYYNCSISSIVNIMVLPWISFIFVLVFSLLFSYLLRKIKICKLLIG